MRPPHDGHRNRTLESSSNPGDLIMKAAVHCRRSVDTDHQEIVSLSRLLGHGLLMGERLDV
jgi:hypothetical protein